MADARPTAIVIGAGGGIGGAFVRALAGSGAYRTVHALSRRPAAADGDDTIVSGIIDVTREDTIRAAADAIGSPVDLVIVATGLLHEAAYRPERALRELDGAALAHVLAVNAIGPALVLKHFAPLLARDRRSVIAALSARVGSISDNRSGGWYGYRASKAALNMIVRSASIELTRSRPLAICVGLHPGTVATDLSAPFQAGVPSAKLFTPDFAAERLLGVLDGLAPDATGRCFAWDRTEVMP